MSADGSSDLHFDDSSTLQRSFFLSCLNVLSDESQDLELILRASRTFSSRMRRWRYLRALVHCLTRAGQALRDKYRLTQKLPTPGSDCLSWLSPFEESTSTVAGSHPWWIKSPMDEHFFHNPEPFDLGFLDVPRSSDDSLILNQVDPNVAHEILGGLFKHSAALKIRCIVNDN